MIRSVAPGDLWSLRRKPRHQLVLYTESLLAQAHRPVLFALRSLLAGNGREWATLTYRDRTMNAVVQAQGRRGRPEQDIVYLAVGGTRNNHVPSDYDLWFRLLERLCINAGHNHIQRLYSAIPSQQRELREIFRQLGFQAYANNTILHLSGPDWDQRTTLASMRTQARRDHWAVHKLYGATTPHLVQHAEVRNARHWALTYGGAQRAAWVLGPDDDLHAYLRLSSGVAGHVFSVLIQPDYREQLVDVLRFGIAQLSDSRPVYVMLREYQGDLLAPAHDLGFQPIGEQTLLVKSTVVPLRRPLLAPSFDPGLEPQVSAPRISTPREDVYPYVRSS